MRSCEKSTTIRTPKMFVLKGCNISPDKDNTFHPRTVRPCAAFVGWASQTHCVYVVMREIRREPDIPHGEMQTTPAPFRWAFLRSFPRVLYDRYTSSMNVLNHGGRAINT